MLKTDSGAYSHPYDLPGGRIDVNIAKGILEILTDRVKTEIGISPTLSEKPISYAVHMVPWHERKLPDEDLHIFYLIFEGKLHDEKIKVNTKYKEYIWEKLDAHNVEHWLSGGVAKAVKEHLEKK